MWWDGGVTSRDALAGEVRAAAVAAGLAPRGAGGAAPVLGAGNDDLGPGRAYLAAMGRWAVPAWPVEHGGAGLGPEDLGVVQRALGAYAMPDLYPFAVGLALVGPTLLVHGTPEQQARWLAPIARGDEIWCQLFSEPDAGSDLAGLTTRAERDGDVWRLAGAKVWASRAHYARWGLCLARTDWSVPKHSGITVFAVDLQADGVEVAPLKQMNGDAHFNQVFLDEVLVPDGDRLGDAGAGWAIARSVLALERGGGAGAPAAGLGLGDTSALLDLVRSADGASAPLARQRAMAIHSDVQARRWAGRRMPGSKLRMADTLKASTSLALEMQGPAGMLADGEWATTFLTAPSLSIRGGTDEIQRNQIGEQALGLPREPAVDRDVPFGDLPRSGHP